MSFSLFLKIVSCPNAREEVESIGDETNRSSHGLLRMETETNFSEGSGNSK